MAAHPAVVRAQASFRGVWVDAFHPGFKSSAEIDELIERALAGNYNVIVAEVLAFQDTNGAGHGAYWNSSILPRATDIAGGIDPLALLCERAHARGLEVDAWLVTYRISKSWPPAGNAYLAARPHWTMVPSANRGGGPAKVGDDYVFDPGSPEVQEHLIRIIRELATNYDIDGINWDYIRYTQKDAGYPADNGYTNSGLARYQRLYGTSSVPPPTGVGNWDEFRRRTIDELVRRARAEIASIETNPRQPLRHTADLICWGNAPSSFTSSSAYGLFQDWQKWMQNGWLDAGQPMIYMREHCPPQNTWYRNWVDRCVEWRFQRHMFCGQAPYLNTFDGSVAQLAYALSRGANGTVSYSYYATRSTAGDCASSAWSNDWSWYNHVSASVFTSPVPPPAMPWRDPATAVEGTVWGRVLNTSGSPVEDASVRVGSLPAVKTDANGYYTATLVPAARPESRHVLRVDKSGLPSVVTPAIPIRPAELVRYDFEPGAAPAQIELSPTGINREILVGESLPGESFTVRNAGDAPLNYAVASNVPWLTVSPSRGNSAGEPDTIAISYDVGGLSAGNYLAVITVEDGLASPKSAAVQVSVTVKPPPLPGDFDSDYDVDQEDFGRFQACLSGTGNSPPAGCDKARMDADADVDQTDLQKFIGCMTGAGVAGDAQCASRP